MAIPDRQLQSAQTVPAEDNGAITYLKQAIAGGTHWYIALLEAIGLWTSVEEDQNGRHCRYLIDCEAFDWLLLAERLCEEVDGLLPDNEKTALLFHGKPPIYLTPEKFKELIGSGKYHQYLNYFYGITVEMALISTVQEEVRKERLTSGYSREQAHVNEVYQRIYGATQATLLKRFRREKGYPHVKSIGLDELKEFTYWLFKYRLKNCDGARVASDTRKALDQLRRKGIINGFYAGTLTD